MEEFLSHCSEFLGHFSLSFEGCLPSFLAHNQSIVRVVIDRLSFFWLLLRFVLIGCELLSQFLDSF